MEKLLSVFNLCKEAREKGFITSISYNGDVVDLYHQEPVTYRIIIHISTYPKFGYTGLDEIERYLKELIA
ncbi:hypothetical protein [Anaerocolumna chitinilytica]|uniref:Uncharacterized protein n=1 Tax=Anaerocolumna chitinilytica TaxID=1727145 RepID=A0A7M3SAL8_9FIRM|nr:hypothetical protein [Anaerocolumna chitinilytica]BCK01636.1 hypothetical protein bsdcttw_46760 [Anaerocolumna chitinilytica]